MTGPRPARAAWLGRRRYGPIHDLQHRLQEARADGLVPDTLLLLEHEPVATLGRKANPSHLRLSPELLRARGVEVHATDRGGDVTFHGPGQLVAYPIFDLKPHRCDVRRYVHDLGRVMRALLAHHGLDGAILEGAYLGVWVDLASPHRWPGEDQAMLPAKIGAIGVRMSRWVTMHGFALNSTIDLDLFAGSVIPCGIAERGITSFGAMLEAPPSVQALAEAALDPFADLFDLRFNALLDLSALPEDVLSPLLLSPGTP
ncbi:MAG: lipoyl(octanoyl) transferase LipB [Myxococcales bacterium]|nr:lipoyl(octanoyl) transferase LipB [Polyangiaceae bacterium]MDW8251175.1 lipoyl(octanoyl) transferase LipB [Myxococcales bacterium]